MPRYSSTIHALAALLFATAAAADPTTPHPSAHTTPPTTTSAPAAANGLDFDLLDAAPKKGVVDRARDQEFDEKVHRRRLMLQWHQGVGLATLAGLAVACIIGQLNYQDKYAATGTDDGRYYNAHLGLGVATSTMFAVSGMLALTAPNPYPKPVRLDSALVHKLSMALATAGMVAQVVLGPIVSAREGKLDQKDWALAHLVTGYATFGFMATGVVAYVF